MQTNDVPRSLRNTLMREYPDVYNCAQKVVEYFRDTWGWDCSDDEIVYLIMHIQRVYEREKE